MKCSQKRNASNPSSVSVWSLTRMFFVMAFLTFGCGHAISQEASEITPGTFPELNRPSSDNAEVSTSSSKMDMVIWFMGNKQGTPVGSGQNGATTVGKKSFINSGMKPNRTLIKSFLKKAVNYDTTLV